MDKATPVTVPTITYSNWAGRPISLKKLNISAKSANISHRYGIQIEKPSREREFLKNKIP